MVDCARCSGKTFVKFYTWWFWTVVGLATAGVVTGIVVATYPREPGVPQDAQAYEPMF
ncbi:MAG: hypothetical protein U1A78_31885 [Polyangia bacterium]